MSILDNNFPQLNFNCSDGYIPSKAECYALWDKYEMLSNIKEHSELVADFARAIVQMINEKYPNTFSEDLAYAAGLLHDIAKSWTIKHGGNHQQLGASIVRAETGNTYLSSCVYHHVIWPWESGDLAIENKIFHLPLIIAYADKRVRHSSQVTLKERFDDLLDRYGKTEEIRKNIDINYQQALRIEKILSQKLEFELYACTLNSGILVA